MRSLCQWIIIGCLCFLLSNVWAGEAETPSVLDKTFRIYGGARIYQADGTFSSTILRNRPYDINMDDVGLDKNETSFIGGFTYSFAKRWNLHFDYYGYHDEALKSAQRNFEFGNASFPVGASVTTGLDIDLYVLNLSYNIIHTEKSRLGLGLGIHGINFDMKMAGKVFMGSVERSTGEAQEDFIAPIPNIWAHGAYAFTDRFLIRYGAGWISAGYDEYDGELLLAQAALEYWPFKNAGIGAGYHYITADIERDGGDRTQRYDVDLSGFIFYLTMGF